jgi:expansin (peptidoglycan-binding protein)
MAFTQADLDAIDKAIASGVQRVRYPDGSEVTYRTQAELEAARGRISTALAPTAALSNRAFLARF